MITATLGAEHAHRVLIPVGEEPEMSTPTPHPACPVCGTPRPLSTSVRVHHRDGRGSLVCRTCAPDPRMDQPTLLLAAMHALAGRR